MANKVHCPICCTELKFKKLKVGDSYKYCYICPECYYVVVIRTSFVQWIKNIFKRKK